MLESVSPPSARASAALSAGSMRLQFSPAAIASVESGPAPGSVLVASSLALFSGAALAIVAPEFAGMRWRLSAEELVSASELALASQDSPGRISFG